MTVEDYLKKGIRFDAYGGKFWTRSDKDGDQLIADLRGWGNIQYIFKSEKEAMNFQDELGEWIADAINEKLKGATND